MSAIWMFQSPDVHPGGREKHSADKADNDAAKKKHPHAVIYKEP